MIARIPRSALVLAWSCLALAAAAEPAPAVIYKLTDKGVRAEGNGFQNAYVTEESVDGVKFVLDDPNSQTSVALRYGTYELTYRDSENIDFLRACGQEEAGQAAKAADLFQKAAQAAKLSWEKEESLLRAARNALTAKQPDEVLAAVAQLEKDAPRSIRLATAIRLRGDALAAKGDADGAAKAYAALSAMGKDWGERAAFLGARGQAGLLRTAGKHAEAAAALAALVAKLPADSDDVGPLVLEQGDATLAAGKAAEAANVYRGMAFKPVAPSIQARARLGVATALAAGQGVPALTKAFDMAVMAAATAGAEPATVAQAKTLMRTISGKLDKDPSLTPADKTEFQNAISSF